MELQIMIGHALRQRRQALGLTLREVSRRSFVSIGFLSEVERGKKPISSDAIWSLCNALNLPLYVLLSEVSELLEQAERRESYVTA